jgi:glycosyltransferase involved in cell wall biosynthesis
VIIPTRDRGAFLREAIESVLAQTIPPQEVIVVDDGSTGEAAAWIGEARGPVCYLRQDAAGPAAARNRGLQAATGAFIAFLDDDDLWPPKKTERQLPHLLQNPELGMILGHTQRMVKRETPDGGTLFEAYRKPVRLFSLGCGLYRRSVFDTVGSFNERMRFAEDDDWFMRCREQDIATVFLPEVSQYYRFHEGNMTRDGETKRRFLLHLVKNRRDRGKSGEESQDGR